MTLKALSNINSGQYVAGDIFDVDDATAEQLIEAGAAIRVDGDDTPDAEPTTVSDEVESTPSEPATPPQQEAPASNVPLEPSSSENSSAPSESTPIEVKVEPQPTQAEIDQALKVAESGASEPAVEIS